MKTKFFLVIENFPMIIFNFFFFLIYMNLKNKKFKSRKIKDKNKNLNYKKKFTQKLNSSGFIWNKFGFVYSPKKHKYFRLGSYNSLNVIKNELKRDKEWNKRVLFLSKKNNKFGNQLKLLI